MERKKRVLAGERPPAKERQHPLGVGREKRRNNGKK